MNSRSAPITLFRSRAWLAGAISCLLAASLFARGQQKEPSASADRRSATTNRIAERAVQLNANSLGDLDSPVSIVVFADLECPFSAATFPVLQQLVEKDPAHIHLIVKQFPLSIHEHAELAGEAADAAGAQGKYFEMADLIQANQRQMTRAQYLHYARYLHLDVKEFARDLDEHRYRASVKSDLAEGVALGVNSTPTLLINGRMLKGSQSPEALEAAIQQSLAPADRARPAEDSNGELAPVDMSQLARDPTAERGSPSAPITIVEFADFQCPFCRRAEEPLAQLLAQPGAPVRYIFRNFPLDFHEHAELAAEAALAARAQGKFWQMHDLLFANQRDLSRDKLIQIAADLHLDVARFSSDLDSGKYKADVAADRLLGVNANVNGTPTFFINGRRMDGALSLAELNQAIALASAGAAGSRGQVNAGPASPVDRTSVLIGGDRNAPVTLTWFSDIQTAAAARMGQLMQQVAGLAPVGPADGSADGRPNRSNVRVIFKFFAVPGHSAAPLAHLALVNAAAQGKFWQLYDALVALRFTGNPDQDRAAIVRAAKFTGLDSGQIEQAMDAGPRAAVLVDDAAEAEWRGIHGAPTLFINQFRVDGVQSASLYDSYIQRALAEASTGD